MERASLAHRLRCGARTDHAIREAPDPLRPRGWIFCGPQAVSAGSDTVGSGGAICPFPNGSIRHRVKKGRCYARPNQTEVSGTVSRLCVVAPVPFKGCRHRFLARQSGITVQFVLDKALGTFTIV
jgi:hypothetical protein